MKLGKLQEIDIRKVWSHEQYDFSKWLANEDNIKEIIKLITESRYYKNKYYTVASKLIDEIIFSEGRTLKRKI